MALSYTYSNSWSHSLCESCLKNSHEEQKMILKKVISPHDESKYNELYVCAKCGFTRRL